MAHSYTVETGDRVRAVLLATFVLCCDVGLKVVARIGASCSDATGVLEALQHVLGRPEGCVASNMAGPSIVLMPHVHAGVLLGRVGAFEGVLGQLWGLALVFVATLTSILVYRWEGRANGDPRALACIWAGVLALAVPRFVSGVGLAEVLLFGCSFGVGALAMLFGLSWLAVRLVAEWRG